MVKCMSEDLKKVADEIIQLWKKKLDDAKAGNANWGKTIIVIFPDIETGYALKFATDGTVETQKKPASECKIEGDAVVNAIGNVLDVKDVSDGKWSPMDAYVGMMLKVDGAFGALNHLLPCFPEAGISM
jgi:hypothetical protein